MRKLLALLAVILLSGPGANKAGAAELTVDLFYQSLEPHGEWIETTEYGYVWSPREVAENWRPYTVGNWVFTEAGWTWVSEEPHGWATHHYGRWVRIKAARWVWVPDTEWGPAWVSWRRSTRHVGWAPLPPEARFRKQVGIKAWADSYYDIGPEYYSFVEVRQFGAPRLAQVVLPPRENVTIIRETKNITNITVVNNYVYNGGPEYDVIVRESVEPVRRLRIERRTDIAFDRGEFNRDVLRTAVAGNALRIVAPDVRFTPSAAPRRVARRLERVEVDRGWSIPNVEDRQLQQLRAEIRKESPEPPRELPREPKYDRTIADVSEKGDKPGRAGRPTEEDRLSPPGAPADRAQPGATVGTPGAEERMQGQRPGRGERKEGQRDATPAEGAVTQPGKPTTAPADADAATAPATPRDRLKRQGRMEREKPATPGAEAPLTTPSEEPSAPATTTPSDSEGATRKERDANREKKADREKPGKPDAEVPATTPAAKTPGEETTAPATSTPADSEGATRKERDANREKKADREKAAKSKPESAAAPAETEDADRAKKRSASQSERKTDKPDASAPSLSTPPDSPATPKRSQEREKRGERSSREPSATAGERPERPERPNRPERPETSAEAPKADRPERPERAERGNNRPEAAAVERRAGGREADRPKPQASAPGGGEERERPGRADRGNGGGDRPGRGEGGGRERGPGGAGGPEAAGAPGR